METNLSRVKRAGKTLENQIALLQFRFWGNLIVTLLLIGLIVYYANQSNYIVLDPVGNVYIGQKAERTDRNLLLIDADAHARYFYNTFWSFDHNNIKEQMRKADDLGGEIVATLYKTLQENGFYKEVVKNGYYVKASIDSISERDFKFDGKAVKLRIYGHMTLENNVFIETRDLDMDLTMYLVDRIRERNPNGMSIEGINILTNETLKVEEKQ